MEDFLLHQLGKALYSLEKLAPGLNDLLAPSSMRMYESRVSQAPGSRPPLSLSIMDLKLETERVLARWCGRLAADLGERPRIGIIKEQALWLRERILDVEERPWARLCADQCIAQAGLVQEVVNPHSVRPIELPSEGGVREMVSWAKAKGIRTSKTAVYEWIAAGLLPHRKEEEGTIIVELAKVIELAKNTGGRR